MKKEPILSTKKKIKKLEFSQRLARIIIFYAMYIVIFTITLNFVLLWNGKQPMPEETVQTITVFGGIVATAGTVVYGALTGFRNHSKNKTGVTHLEMEVKDEQANNLGETEQS